MSTVKMFFAGSGGQGILLMGQMVTYAGMNEDKEVTFLPSYGPEMRGGTANCTVIVSDNPISCPIIYEADVVVAMNLPSLIKFESLVKPGGYLFINTSLIDVKATRTDINIVEVAANDIALKMGAARSANMIMLGEIIRRVPVAKDESFIQLIEKTFSRKGENVTQQNIRAFRGEY